MTAQPPCLEDTRSFSVPARLFPVSTFTRSSIPWTVKVFHLRPYARDLHTLDPMGDTSPLRPLPGTASGVKTVNVGVFLEGETSGRDRC